MTASFRLRFDFRRLKQNVAKRCACLYVLSVLHLLPDLVTIFARVVLPFCCFSLVVRVVYFISLFFAGCAVVLGFFICVRVFVTFFGFLFVIFRWLREGD